MVGISWGDVKRRPRPWIGGLVAALALLVAAVGAGTPAAPQGPNVAVIVQRAANSAPGATERSVQAAHGQIGRSLDIIDSFSAQVPQSELARLRDLPAVGSVVPDASVHMLSSVYEPTTDFGSMYNAQLRSGVLDLHTAGLTGKGVTVALIDTGVVPVNGLRTAGKIVYGPDLSFESQAVNLRNLDTFGHGTHMAGIIAGRDDAAVAPYTDPANFTGVAPDARILSVKIGDARGATDVSTMIAAIDWVVAHRNDNGMNVRVMSLSFGTDSEQMYMYDPIANAVENAWAKGIVVVASAGNRGWYFNRLDNPAKDPFVIAVGSVSYNSSTPDGKQLQVLGKCLLGKDYMLVPGTQVVTSDCNNTPNQRWNVRDDGTVFNLSSGLCLDLAGGASANGTKVVLNTCGTTANQRWTGTFAQTLQLVNPASGRCLEVPTTTPANGTMLDIATCGTGSNQRFTFPLGDDAMSTFSSGGDGSRNADVSAPGQSIAGLRAPGSYVDATYASTGAVGTRFFRGSGTSQATAFVSGLVALQLQRRPSATPDDIKSELKGLAVPLKDVEPRIQGSGSVDASKLLSRGTASAPAQTWSRSAGYGAGNALQNARGSMSLSMDNVVLSGERDIFGKAFDAQAMASSRWTGSSWSGGTWNGSAWSGSSWSGSSWSGSSWSGSSWSGSRWTAQSWSANVWDGSRWTGSSWSGSTWSGSSWSGSTWSNTLWGR